MSGGISTVSGGIISSNFTSSPGQTIFSSAFNTGTVVTSIFGQGAFSVGGSTDLSSAVALTGNGMATTLTGAGLVLFSGSNDTLTAAGTQPYAVQLGDGSVLNEGAGPSTVYASSGASTVNAGSGSTTVVGSSGSLSFVGGASGNDSVTAGSGPSTLTGGSGGSNTLVGGSGSTTINLLGGSTGDHIVAGTGVTDVDAANTTGNFEIDTNPAAKGTLQATLGSGADTAVGGGGTSVIQAGSGADVFGFVNGAAGGAETILGFNATLDTIVYDNYGYSLGHAPPEHIGSLGDVITLSDGTSITLVGVFSKLYS
jgi:Ca2+-binding RTX toxin-like protein